MNIPFTPSSWCNGFRIRSIKRKSAAAASTLPPAHCHALGRRRPLLFAENNFVLESGEERDALSLLFLFPMEDGFIFHSSFMRAANLSQRVLGGLLRLAQQA